MCRAHVAHYGMQEAWLWCLQELCADRTELIMAFRKLGYGGCRSYVPIAHSSLWHAGSLVLVVAGAMCRSHIACYSMQEAWLWWLQELRADRT